MTEAEVAARPQWMNENLLKTCITRSLNIPSTTDVDIVDVAVTYAVPKGENYLSVIYRALVNFHIVSENKSNGVKNGSGSCNESLIFKVSHDSEGLKKIAEVNNVFPKETDMYVNMVPTLTKTLKSAGISGQLACRCLHSVEGERDMLVMEDLKMKGYILADRLRGLDLSHCKLVFDKLAKLHASSMHFYKSKEVPDIYAKSAFDLNKDILGDDMLDSFTNSMHQKVAQVLTELRKYSHYAKQIDFFERFDKIPLDVMFKLWRNIPGNKFNAILHGDCWVNNMMFKYNEDGSVQDVLLIDLQISYWSSIANDFIYFFFSSSNKDVRRNNLKELQDFYISNLTKYLNKLGYTGDIPTLAEFKIELKRVSLIAIYMITQSSAIMLNEFSAEQKSRDKAETFDMKDIIEFMDLPSRNYFERFLASVDTLEENGFFDEMLKAVNSYFNTTND